MDYTPEQREKIARQAEGKRVVSLEWEEADGGYWAMEFDDGTEISFRFMSELRAID
jgi:hypothetical protein